MISRSGTKRFFVLKENVFVVYWEVETQQFFHVANAKQLINESYKLEIIGPYFITNLSLAVKWPSKSIELDVKK